MPNSSDFRRTERNRFTRMCIGEAILALMEEQSYESITVLGIVRKAGISRMTYYQYYHSKAEALNDYLKEIITEYMQEREKRRAGRFMEYQHILFSLNFFDRYADFFLKLASAGLYSLIINAVNDFMLHHMKPFTNRPVYQLYAYAGSLLNVFLKWEEGGKKEAPEEIARFLCESI